MCAPPPSDFLGGSQELFPTRPALTIRPRVKTTHQGEVFVPGFAALPAAPSRPAPLAPVEILN
jgi:hypothetical protein